MWEVIDRLAGRPAGEANAVAPRRPGEIFWRSAYVGDESGLLLGGVRLVHIYKV